MKRQLTEQEKEIVRQQQMLSDGSLRCFISGEIISEADAIEYDHIKPFSKDGDTDTVNIRIVLKKYNRRKADQSLSDVRDNLKLERLFEQKKNNIKLQDIFELKELSIVNTHAHIDGKSLKIDDGQRSQVFSLLHDEILDVDYFYGRVPIRWLENDDQEGLQPRVIDYKRLIRIRDHLKNHPQLAPSIARLVDSRLKLFDGQHKLAGQVLNNHDEIDVKVYVSPNDPQKAKELFDGLMITNLEAHSKLKQVPFYTSTLLDRLSVIHKELLDEFILTQAPEEHTEANFLHFLRVQKQYSRADCKKMLRSAIKSSALEASPLKPFVAIASKDPNFPMTIDLLDKTIFPATLYLEAAVDKFTSSADHRNLEVENFREVSQIIVDEGFLNSWVPNVAGKALSQTQLKARRIWHKGSVLTWAPYLKSILYIALHAMTNEERERVLYRSEITDDQKRIIKLCLNRLFSHNMWDEPEGEIDSLLVSAQKQDELFNRKGLTEKFVIYGKNK